MGIALNVQEDKTPITWVEAVDIERVLGLRAAGTVSKFVKVAANLQR